MKLGFSSLVCPTWSLEAILEAGKNLGFTGVELRGLQGEPDLTRSSELADDPEGAKRHIAEAGLELVCLGTSASFTARQDGELRDNIDLARRHIELARRLGARMVRVSTGNVPRGGTPAEALPQAGRVLAELGPFAVENGVIVVVENTGGFSRTEDLWFQLDSADHPAIKCCLNAVACQTQRERPTITVPRMAPHLGLVHLADARVDSSGNMDGFVMPGTGDVEIEPMVTLLRGIGYDGYLIFEWPKSLVPELPEPDEVLPKFKELVSGILEAEQPVLTAYKGDKRAPKYRRQAAS